VINRFIIFILFPVCIFKKKLILGYLLKTNQTTTMNQPATPQGQSVSINLHQQRILALVFAAIAFIGMILPWSVTNLGFSKQTSNGFAEWGILALFGVAGVVVASLLGDKTRELEQNFRYIAIGSFVAIVLGSFIQFMKIVNISGLGVKTGVGVWFCIIGGILGLLSVTGVLKSAFKAPASSPTSPSVPPAPGVIPPPPGSIPPPPPPPTAH
jgi:hypothetical protein